MITSESQVRLSIELQGRLASTGANSSSKKERAKANKLARYGKTFRSNYTEPTYHEARQCVTLSSECVHYYASEDGKPSRILPSAWKKLKPIQRLEANLQVYADYLAGHAGTKFSYEILN